MTSLPTPRDLESEISVLQLQLERVQAERAKLLEKEGDIRTKMQHVQIKLERLVALGDTHDDFPLGA